MRILKGGVMAVLLDDGEAVADGISDACRTAGTDSAMILSGIGMVRESTVGYWNGKDYETQNLGEPMELVSMGGSFAIVNGAPSVHLHVSLAGREHRVVGGHLVSAVAHNINEISVAPFPGGSFGRAYSEKTKLNMLYFKK